MITASAAHSADRLAVAAGTHALEVWGIEWAAAMDEIAPRDIDRSEAA